MDETGGNAGRLDGRVALGPEGTTRIGKTTALSFDRKRAEVVISAGAYVNWRCR